MLCNDISNLFKGKAIPNRSKKQGTGIRPFYSNTSYCFEYTINCISKLSIKVFIKKLQSRKGLCLPNTSEF